MNDMFKTHSLDYVLPGRFCIPNPSSPSAKKYAPVRRARRSQRTTATPQAAAGLLMLPTKYSL